MSTVISIKKSALTTPKTVTPLITTLYLQLNLSLHYGDISLFREAVLHCIENEQELEIFSNETIDKDGKQKNLFQYPLVQYRVRNGYAVLWAMQKAAPLVEKFVQHYSRRFAWRNKPFNLQVQQQLKENNYPIKIFNAKLRMHPVVYRLYVYIPFTNSGRNKNYNWLKENRNLPDIEKTKKLQQLIVNHICSFIHYAGGYIPKKKIKAIIIDKAPLTKIFFNEIEYAAFDLRYTINLNLPDYIGIGNICSHGFGWQRLEKE